MKANINGLEVHYDISGQGPWLMLSHSLAAHGGMWEPQLKSLRQHFTVLRYDIRGHGQTQVTPGPYSLAQLADDAASLLAHLGVARTHWLGLSLGGMIGQVLAIARPDLLDHVVIADSTGQGAPTAAAMWAERAALARSQGLAGLVQPTLSRWFTEPFRQANPALMAEIGQMIGGTPSEGYAGCCEAIATIDTLAGLQGLRLPALIVVGEQDQGTPPAQSEQIHAHWPGSELVLLPQAAHLSNIEQAQAFNEALIRFLPH